MGRIQSVVFALALCLASVASAQTLSRRGKAEESDKTLWLDRANLITAAIQQDAPHLTAAQQLLVEGRLGELWSKVNPNRGQPMLDQALAGVLNVPATETEAEHAARIRAACAMIRDWGQANPGFAQRLLDRLTRQLLTAGRDDKTAAKDRSMLGMALDAAIAKGGRRDLDRVVALAQRAIQLGEADAVLTAYFVLADEAPDRGAQLIRDALHAASTNRLDAKLLVNTASLLTLKTAGTGEYSAVPAALTSEIVRAVADGMLRVPQTPEDKTEICRIAPMAAVLMTKYPMPDRGQVSAAVEACAAADPAAATKIRAVTDSREPGTPGEILRHADTSDDFAVRVQLKLNAAREAARTGDYLGAFDILDAFSQEERETRMWLAVWNAIAIQATRTLYEKREPQEIQRIIARAPIQTRARLATGVATQAFVKKDDAYGLAMATQALNDLKANPVTTTTLAYIALLRLYGAFVPGQTLTALRVVVDGLNRIDAAALEPASMYVQPLGWDLAPLEVEPRLLAADPQAVGSAIADLKSPQMRAAFRLGLLKAYLINAAGPRRRRPT